MKYVFFDNLVESSRRRRGVALVTVLWMGMLMSLVVTLAFRSSMLDTKVSLIEVEKQRCRWGARGGLETACAILAEDDTTSDSLGDLWSDNSDELEGIELEGCQVDVEVIDASSKLNLNTATRNQLLALPDMTEEIADGILDWRDKNSSIRASGAEEGYYQGLDYPYRNRNAWIRTTRELLRVRGVTEELMYATGDRTYLSPENEGWIRYLTVHSLEYNRSSLGQNKVDLNKANEKQLSRQLSLSAGNAKWIVENRPFKKWSDLFKNSNQNNNKQNQNSNKNSNGNSKSQVAAEKLNMNTVLKIVDKAAVSNKQYIPGLVNVNTAGSVVLTALMEGNQTLAENVLAYRLGLEGGLTSLADLQNVEGMTENVLKKLLDSATVRSCVYEVYSTGYSEATALSYQIEAIVNRQQQDGQVLYWHEGIYN